MSNMPYIEAEDLKNLFSYKTMGSFYKAVQRGNLPVATYRFGGKIRADREVVREYFRRQRADALRALDSSGSQVA